MPGKRTRGGPGERLPQKISRSLALLVALAVLRRHPPGRLAEDMVHGGGTRQGMLHVHHTDRPRRHLPPVLRARGSRRRGVHAGTRPERDELLDERPDGEIGQLHLVDDAAENALVVGVLRRGLRESSDEGNDQRFRFVLFAHVRHPRGEVGHLYQVLERPGRQVTDPLRSADGEERLKRLRVKRRPRALRHALQQSLRQGKREARADAELNPDHQSARVLLRAGGGREASLQIREQPRDNR